MRVNAKDQAITLKELKVIYFDGTEDIIPANVRIEAGGAFGPVDLKGGTRPIDRVEAKYRSGISSEGRGSARVEIWAHNHDNDQDARIVCPDDVCTEVPVFFGTDRKQEDDRFVSERKLASFSIEAGGKLVLGRAIVSIPKGGRQTGDVNRPEIFGLTYRKEDMSKDFTLISVEALTQDAFLADVRTQLGKSHTFKDQVMVFVHGYNVTFDDALFRAAQIAHDTDFDGATFVYSWPSRGACLGIQV